MYFSDLISIVYVQFISMVYSVRFLYGYIHLAKRFQKSEEEIGQVLTAGLSESAAVYHLTDEEMKESKEDSSDESADFQMYDDEVGPSGENISDEFAAMDTILKKKYPYARSELMRIWMALGSMRHFVYSMIIQKYRNSSDNPSLELYNFKIPNEGMRYSGSPSANMVDIRGGQRFWSDIDMFWKILFKNTAMTGEFYRDVDDTLIRSKILTLIQYGEKVMVLRKLQVHPSKLYEDISDNILVLQKSDPKLGKGKLQFVKQPLRNIFTQDST